MKSDQHPIRILHVITGLQLNGAENFLQRLVQGMSNRRFCQAVVSLTDLGPVGERLSTSGTSVEALRMRSGLSGLAGIINLRRAIQQRNPHIVQTWMYHADLLGGLAARGASSRRVIWNVRQSALHPTKSKLSTRAVARACGLVSNVLPHRIIYNSYAALPVHRSIGYSSTRFDVIVNGVDCKLFSPDERLRHRVRQELGIPKNAKVVGLVARYDPQKDHPTFLKACSKLLSQEPLLHFILCGSGISWKNRELSGLVKLTGHESQFKLLERRQDMERITAALDLAVSSSLYGEGTSNAILEALACGVPVVATDVGDSARVTGNAGASVPPGNSEELAEAILRILHQSAANPSLRQAARNRALQNYSMKNAILSYEIIYEAEVART